MPVHKMLAALKKPTMDLFSSNFKPFFSGLLLLSGFSLFAQEEPSTESENKFPPRKNRFQSGFYIGSYFANRHSAANYNGYGFDLDGKQNSFQNSAMYQKIKNEYGGGFGQTDYIALELGVDPKQWEFNESDMPARMRYQPAILLGFILRVPIDKTSGFILNAKGTKLNVEGNFTISTLRPQTSSNPVLNSNIKTFPIRGQEQRLQFELGYQKLFGAEEKINFFVELGFIGTLTKFDRSWIQINNLVIDLTYNVNQTINPTPVQARPRVGFGIGAFAGIGINMALNSRVTLQLLGNLLHEKINMGINPALKLQGALGIRVYYNF